MENNSNQKTEATIHKDNSLNRLDLSFIKHIDLNKSSPSLLDYRLFKLSWWRKNIWYF